jgi:hypothetical protein
MLAELVTQISENEAVLAWLGIFSLSTFLLSLVAIPFFIVRIPHDYFLHSARVPLPSRHLLIRLLLLIAKNMLGILFVFIGLALLVLPGQGILTILIGVLFINFPGKYRFEKWLVSRPSVLSSVNWLRQRAAKKPLDLG